MNTLWKCKQNEMNQYQSEKEEKYILNAIVIKGHMFFLDAIQATEIKLNFLYDYLFSAGGESMNYACFQILLRPLLLLIFTFDMLEKCFKRLIF